MDLFLMSSFVPSPTMTSFSKLDNPVWHSLSETHKTFAVEYIGAKFYHPDYCPFGGFELTTNIRANMDAYSSLVNNFFVVGEKPEHSDHVQLVKNLVCCQMLLNDPVEVEGSDSIVELKTPEQKRALLDLVTLVQPGYFKNKTSELGTYFGRYEGDRLVAVTGERMKMETFTEVSAVVTHPDYTGRGYAKQLVAFVSNRVFTQNKIPYLHVAETNVGAIKLYEKLGFVLRRKISFWNFSKV